MWGLGFSKGGKSITRTKKATRARHAVSLAQRHGSTLLEGSGDLVRKVITGATSRLSGAILSYDLPHDLTY